MCGIAGFSLAPESKIKSRQLSNALLTAIEDRGYMASGYAFWHKDTMGYHSEAKPGSSLSLKFMPRRASTVILHTRLATHGSVNDNRNNHPVTSPDKTIALVHNGVIYNHHDVRRSIKGNLPDVDTSVIPALLEQKGIASLNQLDGDAAIAWLNQAEPGVMHLARYQHSPLTLAHLEDGSFVFASTEALLWRALVQLNLAPTWMESANELDYFTIKNGIMQSKEMLPEPMYADASYNQSYYRHQTAGAKGTLTESAPSNLYWDDEEESYYDYEAYDWNQSFLSQPTQSTPAVTKFWTKVQEKVAPHSDYIYYNENERELWLNELYMLADEPGIALIDYGTTDKNGMLVSSYEDSELF